MKAIFPGTFDPITLGHVDLIERAAKIFDQVTVGVSTHAGKQPLFNLEERLKLVKNTFKTNANISATHFEGLLVDFAQSESAGVIIRGIRNTTDFDYEIGMSAMNQSLNNKVETIFLTPKSLYQSISSTLVRDIIKCGGAVSQFVSQPVLDLLKEKHHGA